jgi:hypothetical protein
MKYFHCRGGEEVYGIWIAQYHRQISQDLLLSGFNTVQEALLNIDKTDSIKYIQVPIQFQITELTS